MTKGHGQLISMVREMYIYLGVDNCQTLSCCAEAEAHTLRS